ncbi:hypothetical protein AVEN_239778-1 [Araneus ventricosus]|uniref:Uncharacterized protein n=1 Tax=Araneus ventricosus TaxID=182803 RepID=A0A4Y2ET11_ARAVE|nr:hypothetical protein AVEN_239778-1 [Araneus ventricosus]
MVRSLANPLNVFPELFVSFGLLQEQGLFFAPAVPNLRAAESESRVIVVAFSYIVKSYIRISGPHNQKGWEPLLHSMRNPFRVGRRSFKFVALAHLAPNVKELQQNREDQLPPQTGAKNKIKSSYSKWTFPNITNCYSDRRQRDNLADRVLVADRQYTFLRT